MTGGDERRIEARRAAIFGMLLCGCDPQHAAEVTRLADEVAKDAADRAVLRRRLYRRLADSGLIADGGRQALRDTSSWRQFGQLRPLQQAAIFLVIGEDFSFQLTAWILGQSENRIAMEVLGGLFQFEHVAQDEPRVAPAKWKPQRRSRRALLGRLGLAVRRHAEAKVSFASLSRALGRAWRGPGWRMLIH